MRRSLLIFLGLVLVPAMSLVSCGPGSSDQVAKGQISVETVDLGGEVIGRRFRVKGGSLWFPYANGSTLYSIDDWVAVYQEPAREEIGVIRYYEGEIKIHPVFHQVSLEGEANNFASGVARLSQDLIAYIKANTIELYSFETDEVIQVIDLPQEFRLWGPLHVTQDGTYLSLTGSIGAESSIIRVHRPTGTYDELISPFRGLEKLIANHGQIHPSRPDLLLFAHEGSWVRDRVWLWDLSAGRAKALSEQPEFVEWGHEIWSADGRQVWVVQYGSPQRGVPSGVISLTLEGRAELLLETTDYYFSHISRSSDGRYLALDTYRPDEEGRFFVFLYDLEASTLQKISEVRLAPSHPFHPHPLFAADNRYLGFNDFDPSAQQSSIVIQALSR